MGEFGFQNNNRQPVYAESTGDKKDEIIKQLYPPLRIDAFSEAASEACKKVMKVNFYDESEDYIEELSKIPAFERAENEKSAESKS